MSYNIQSGLPVLDDGTGQEDTDQVTSGAGNTAGNGTLVLNASLPNDTPVGTGGSGSGRQRTLDK